MNLWLQVVLTGLASGSVYGLLAVGHTLVYRLTGIVHFALGDTARTFEWGWKALGERSDYLMYLRVEPRVGRGARPPRVHD